MLAIFSVTRAEITAPMAASGKAMPSQKSTKAMVAICPITAVQRSWIKSAMFLRWVVSPVGGAAPIAPGSTLARLGADVGAASSPSASVPAVSDGVDGLFSIRSRPAREDTGPARRQAEKGSAAHGMQRCAGEHNGEPKPCQCINQVAVVKRHDGQPALRKAAHIGRGIGIDKEWRRPRQASGGRDGLNISRIPAISRGVVIAQETAF